MIKILGQDYYIDIDKLDSYVTIPNISGGTEQHISMIKFEAIKTMIEVIISTEEQFDDAMGQKGTGMSVPFRLAFNTLQKHKILTHI